MPKHKESRVRRSPYRPQSASRPPRAEARRSSGARMSCQARLELRHVRRKLLGSGGRMELGELARALKEEPEELGRVLAQGQRQGQVLVVSRGQRPKPSSGSGFIPLEQEPLCEPRVALARSGVRLCQTKPERCQGRCGNLHLCRYFIFGNCRHSGNSNPCRYIHDIWAGKNRQAVDIHRLEGLNAEEVCLLLLLNDPVLLPEACSHYNRGDGRFGSCTFGKTCSKLHICQHFLQGDCRFGSACKRSHSLMQEENTEKLEKWGVGYELIQILPEIYRNAFEIKNNIPSQPTEKSSLPGPVTPTYCLDENSLSPTSQSHRSQDCKPTLAKAFLKQSIQIEKGKSNPTIHKLQLQTQKLDTDGYLQMCTFGPRKTTDKDKVIMLLGAKGSGKSTLINGMVNYILGVQWEDGFRFKLVDEGSNRSQAESQTSSITSYHLNHQEGFQVPYNITLIDTPGFGDNGGKDRILIKQIEDLFSTTGGVDRIDAVCFVAQSSLACLTPSHKYIFDAILSLFGMEVAENILLLTTFADGQKPLVLDAIRVADMLCREENGTPVHFKFNNSALFSYNGAADRPTENADEDTNFEKLFWKMSLNGMSKFFKALNKLESRCLE